MFRRNYHLKIEHKLNETIISTDAGSMPCNFFNNNLARLCGHYPQTKQLLVENIAHKVTHASPTCPLCLFQVYRLCHPCQVKYDFIGRLETLETDAEHLLKLLKVDHLVHFPSGARNRTAASWEKAWFSKIPTEMRRELYKLYEPDFELFGYPKPDSVLHE